LLGLASIPWALTRYAPFVKRALDIAFFVAVFIITYLSDFFITSAKMIELTIEFITNRKTIGPGGPALQYIIS
jgi:hypothetical protein